MSIKKVHDNQPKEFKFSSENLEKVTRIIDRREAIEMALSIAKKNDIVLVAGKGHESFQEINGIKNNFDDFEVIKNIIS